jgi:hypothetical protein
MSEEDQVDRALKDLQIMYQALAKDGDNFDIRKYYTGNYFSQNWSHTPSTGLAFFDAD